MKKKCILLLFLLVVPLSFALEQNLIYDSAQNTVKLGYDELNRVVNKNASSEIINYSYDAEVQGTLSNITFGNSTYKYSYDDKLRVIEEKRIIDGIEFTKTYIYDSNDRLVAELFNGEQLSYYFGKQGKIDRINGYVNDTNYNAFGNPLNRTYSNAKLMQFDYYPDNARLRQIKTETIQILNYSYDNVGNIVQIDDQINSRLYSMSYDYLDRLTNVSIGEYSWVYGYNSIGNVLKIVRNFSTTTSFKFDKSIAHAPQKYIVSNTSVDVYRYSGFESQSKNKAFGFFLVNEKNKSVEYVNWSAEFGDNFKASSSQPFNLSSGQNIMVIVEHNYTRGGSYGINLTGGINASRSDYEALKLMFGSKANDLYVLKKNSTLVVTVFSAENKDNPFSTNWGWNCSNSVVSAVAFNMSSGQELLVIMEHNYSLATLDHNLNCMVNSTDGNQSIALPFSFGNIEIEDYNSTITEINTVEVKFKIKNHFGLLNDIEWNITTDNRVFQSALPISLSQGEETTIIQKINFTTRGVKPLKVTVYSGNFSDTYPDSIRLYSLNIRDFMNLVKNGTTRVFNFFIQNDWVNVTAYWNVSNPELENTVNLTSNESLLVIIEQEFSQGINKPLIRVFNQTDKTDEELDVFEIRQIDIKEFETLHENSSSTLTYALVLNNINPLNVSWSLNNSQETIEAGFELSTSQQAFVIVESNFSQQGIYPLNFHINSSSYNDNQTGVAIS